MSHFHFVLCQPSLSPYALSCSLSGCTFFCISGCSVCPTATRRPRREVRQAACTATFQGFFRVTAVDSSSGVVSVRLSKLEVDCPHCDGDLLSKAALREVKKLVLPCQCPLVLNQKYLLLDSVVWNDDRFVLSEDAVILPRSQSKVVTTIHTEGTCSWLGFGFWNSTKKMSHSRNICQG